MACVLLCVKAIICTRRFLTGLVLLTAHVTIGQISPQGFSTDQQARLKDSALRNPRVAALAHGQKVRALSIAAAEPTKEQGQGTESPPVADVFLINYGNNKGIRVRLNVETGEALEVQEMKGRPQSSLEEQAEAEALIRRDARMAALFRDGASVVGGFVVDPPEGTPTQGRYLEFHVVNADRKRILHKVFVDLATERSYIDAQRRRDPKLTIGGKHHAH